MRFAPHRTWFGDTRMHSVLFDVLKRNPPVHVRIDMQSVMASEENHLMHLYGQHHISHAKLTHIELEAKGGPCPKCSAPWIKRHVDNIFCQFFYYEPACTCYPICFSCGALLLTEIVDDIPYCTTCRRVERCRELVEMEVTTPAGRTLKRRQRCTGRMLLSASGYICENCGRRVNYYLEDGVIVPLAYIGGASRQ